MSTVVLNQEQRVGSASTASRAVPAATPPLTTLIVSGTASDADAQDATKSCIIIIHASWDGGSTYQPVGDPYAWQGGIGPKGNFTKPAMTTEIPKHPDTGVQADRIMATLDTLGLNTGLTIDFA